MHWINWLIVVVYLVYVVWDGLRRAKGTNAIEGYFLANRDLPWWAVGLSVMATQLSAVTMIGTTGQGATDGMRFVQFYFGLPIAMVILGVTLVPFLHGAKVFTAYEYLERRFDAKTRSLTSFLFLLSRGMSCGAIISAPAVVFSAIFGWPLALVGRAHRHPDRDLHHVRRRPGRDVGRREADGADRRRALRHRGDPRHAAARDAGRGPAGRRRRGTPPGVRLLVRPAPSTYTFWSGIIGGTFLMLSYFGTDQSQVQRYLTARSVDEARSSLLMSAYWKIPLQALILLIGVLVFVFYLFQPPPLLFNPAHERSVRAADPAGYAIARGAISRRRFEARRAAATALAEARRETTPLASASFLAADSSVQRGPRRKRWRWPRRSPASHRAT